MIDNATIIDTANIIGNANQQRVAVTQQLETAETPSAVDDVLWGASARLRAGDLTMPCGLVTLMPTPQPCRSSPQAVVDGRRCLHCLKLLCHRDALLVGVADHVGSADDGGIVDNIVECLRQVVIENQQCRLSCPSIRVVGPLPPNRYR